MRFCQALGVLQIGLEWKTLRALLVEMDLFLGVIATKQANLTHGLRDAKTKLGKPLKHVTNGSHVAITLFNAFAID